MYVIGDATEQEREHVQQCNACQQKINALVGSLGEFRSAVHQWSERAGEHGWTVIPPAGHLDRLLLPTALEVPWYRSLWNGLCDFVRPVPPPLDVTSKPVLVQNIWGQYGRRKSSWAASLAFQSAVVAGVFAIASTDAVRQAAKVAITPLIAPNIEPYEPKIPVAKNSAHGGGGGGDRSSLPASKGRLPKVALKQFTPPVQVANNLNPKLTMDPSIIAPPDINLPHVNMAQYGDPLARLGPPSNGPGSGGGIGSGKNGGIGSGIGAGVGPGDSGGFGGGLFKVGGGVSAPALIFKVEPEYSEEARKAKYQGTVVLYVEVDPNGHARNMRVVQSLGLGLDEKAIEAVNKWKFRPGYKDGKPVTVAATIEVNFRLL